MDHGLEIFGNLGDLKDLERTGWQQKDVEDAETVASHSWGAAVLALHYGRAVDWNVDIDGRRYSLDPFKTVSMALLHDTEQAISGDLPSKPEKDQMQVSPDTKKKKEEKAVEELYDHRFNYEKSIWNQTQEMESAEAIFVEDMEQIDMVLQALKYTEEERTEEDMEEFFLSAGESIQTDVGEVLYNEVLEKYEDIMGNM